MELLILKNGEIFARATADGGNALDYTFATVENLPEYPAEKPGEGMAWELVYNNGECAWEAVTRERTAEERLKQVEDWIIAQEYPEFVRPTGAHDCYNVGGKMTYLGGQWVSLIDGNVWTPDEYPEGWEEV